jgi:hypothetical protein
MLPTYDGSQSNSMTSSQCIGEIGGGDMDRIDLAQDKDQWRALVNMVMKLRAP